MQIRIAKKGDIAQIFAIERECFLEKAWTPEMFKDALKHPLYTFWVAQQAYGIAGYLCVKTLGNEAEIENLAVKTGERGKGFAQKLLETAIEFLQKNRAEKIFLEVDTKNIAALGLYEKNGFVKQRVREAYYGAGLDAWECVKVL